MMFNKKMLGLDISEKQKWKRSSLTGDLVSTAEGRHPSWFEAVFDLIIVASFSALGKGLQRNLESSDTLGHFTAPIIYMLQFGPIYTSWSVLDLYINRFGIEGLLGGFTVLINTIVIAVMNFTLLKMNTSEREEDMANAFVNYCLCNLATNVVTVIMFIRVYFQTNYKRLSFGSVIIHSLFGTLWLVLACLGDYPVQKYVLWCFLWLLEHHRLYLYMKVSLFLEPHFSEETSKFVPIDIPLFIERNGLLVVIAIGECLMATVEAGQNMSMTFESLKHISIAVLHAFILKIAFFDVMDSAGEDAEKHAFKNRDAAMNFSPYMLYAVAGITLSSQMLKDAEEYRAHYDETGEPVPVSAAFLFAASMALMLLAFFNMSLWHEREEEAKEVVSITHRSLVLGLVGLVMAALSIFVEWTDPYNLELCMQGLFAFGTVFEFGCRYYKHLDEEDGDDGEEESADTFHPLPVIDEGAAKGKYQALATT